MSRERSRGRITPALLTVPLLVGAVALALWGLRGLLNAYRPMEPPAAAAPAAPERPAAPPPVAEPADRAPQTTPVEKRERPHDAVSPPLPDEPPPPDLGPPPQRRRQLTVESGLGNVPAPGTKPLMEGVVVPDDYPLPEGFMRHYQVTDKGESLEPILRLHPDYELLDENGDPIPLGPGRIVPPEWVPGDMPVRKLEMPADGGLADDAP
ncbi:MAG: hypothetical protein ACQGVK_24785 [Myxococcota bacterium]